ncbi:MAG: sigma 54-interacting transcriptional regulator [Deltaproteobacteria bacterium]|uniref:Sigma 54-interacting transcriptional regulator n=1 Tax=Candidatus Zymogenus saltonus TaxID=2844893 RepID=A0A9D8KAC9_9DELT|nr:sigma 54-interacting transcriptional regulator [Candidatus Zymogenus saltonus]
MAPRKSGPPFKRAVIFHLDEDVSSTFRNILEGRKIDVWEEKNLRDLRFTLKTYNPDFLFIGSGYVIKREIGFISSLKKGTDGLSIVVVSTLGDREGIHPFLDESIFSVILDPYHPKEIAHLIKSAEGTRRAEIQDKTLKGILDQIANPNKFFIGKSPNAIQVRKSIQNAKKDNAPILITGEGGTGKTHISYSIHVRPQSGLTSIRIYDPISEPERGRGLVKYVESLGHLDTLVIKNTQHLDSVELNGLVSMMKESERWGENLPRFILHHNPSHGIPHRFDGFSSLKKITIDPLRERRNDIRLLVDYFQNIFTKHVDGPKVEITPPARKLLKNYRWPYNVTELMGVILYGIVSTGGGAIYPFNFPDFITISDPFAMEKMSLENFFLSKLTPVIKKMSRHNVEGLYPIVLSRMEIPLIKLVLQETGGNQLKTAKILGINRNTLMKKIKKHKIVINEIDS